MSHTRILLCFGLVSAMFAQDSSTVAPPSLFPQSPLSFKVSVTRTPSLRNGVGFW